METRLLAGNHQEVTAAEVEQVIRGGGIAAIPTDTVYGLVCDARNESAVRRMFAMKERPQERAFPVFVRDIAMARWYAYISDTKAKFLEAVWPGAVTVVFHHKEKLPVVLTGDKDTLGLRIPDHAFVSAVLVRIDFPLAQTSANISDLPASMSGADVIRYFEGRSEQPDLVVDGGTIPGAPSTVIDFTGATPLILRAGPVSKQDLDAFLSQAE